MRLEKSYNWWLSLGALALVLFFLTCIRHLRRLGISDGLQPYVFDGTIQHKVGELFLWIPFYFIGLATFHKTKSELEQMIYRFAPLMFLGGVLNLISWFSLKSVVIWHPFCWVVFFWGLFAVPLCKWLFLPRAKADQTA